MAWNDACRCLALVAHRESKYSPNAATEPDNTQVIIPGIIPADAIAYAKEKFQVSSMTFYL